MRVVFLGTAGYHPNETRQTACVMLPEFGIVFDAGTGFFRVRDQIRTSELHIFLSHYHKDHIDGLNYLLDVTYEKRVEVVHLYGKQPILELHKQFQDPFFPVTLDKHSFKAELHEWSPQVSRWAIGKAVIEARMFTHLSGGSLGYRLTHEGKTLVYITDTIVTADAAAFVQDADLFICETNFPNAMKDLAVRTTHSYPKLAAEVAKAANVKHLVLYHVNPLLKNTDILKEEVLEVFSGEVTVAEDKMILNI